METLSLETYRMSGQHRIRAFLSNRTLLGVSLLALLLNGALWWHASTTIGPQPESVPVHYNIYFGIDLLGPWWYLLLLPAGGAFVLVVNLVLAVLVYRADRLASYFLTIGGAIVQLFVGITAYLLTTQLFSP